MIRTPLTLCSCGYFLGSIVSGRIGPRFDEIARASHVKASRLCPARDNAKAKYEYSRGHDSPRQYPPQLGVSNARVGRSGPLNFAGSVRRFIIAAMRAGSDS